MTILQKRKDTPSKTVVDFCICFDRLATLMYLIMLIFVSTLVLPTQFRNLSRKQLSLFGNDTIVILRVRFLRPNM